MVPFLLGVHREGRRDEEDNSPFRGAKGPWQIAREVYRGVLIRPSTRGGAYRAICAHNGKGDGSRNDADMCLVMINVPYDTGERCGFVG
ncbi:hypothetical protein Taro_003143 [Colocasia esculenta]|uniref:Uncharacterized protein n=1 Tax=Colocasia esculenta TaxID=4460 RepID=A0A843TG37_COLES|nr:hypothetical protein [Colocasia esculenta]